MEFVDKHRQIRGVVPLSSMDRLRDEILNEEGGAEVELEFCREGRLALIKGKVSADLLLECHCCLEPLPWNVRTDVELGIVGSLDEADRLPEGLEPLLIAQGERMAINDIVQDELLLAIPNVPQHERCEIPIGRDLLSLEENPFAVLKQFKESLKIIKL